MKQNEKIGIVISKVGNKTINVLTTKKFQHKKYNKIITKHKKYMVHDELNQCNLNNKIIFKQSKPYSKKKRYIFKEFLII